LVRCLFLILTLAVAATLSTAWLRPTRRVPAVMATTAHPVDAAPDRLPSDDAPPDDVPPSPECVCPQTAACADADAEQRCLEYLGNASNVVAVEPMLSTARFGRTAKLRLRYRDGCVGAVAKLPQSLFPLEPYAEYAAFEIDRLLGFGKVPPTTWVFLPIADIEASTRRYPATGANATADAQAYAVWVSTEVMAYAMRKGLVVPHPDTGRMVLGCSAQLLIRRVKPPSKTTLALDDVVSRQLLRGGGMAEAAVAGSLPLHVARRVSAWAAAAADGDRDRHVRSDAFPAWAADVTEHDAARGAAADTFAEEERTAAWVSRRRLGRQRFAALPTVLQHASDTAVFDAVIGNDDRSTVKNAHCYVFAPGVVPRGCEAPGAFSAAHGHVGFRDGGATLRFLWLDQGKSFYRQWLPPPLRVRLSRRDAQCTFRAATHRALLGVAGGRLAARLRAVLPPPIWRTIGEERVAWAAARVDAIIAHIDACVAAAGGNASRVMVFP
jgi:hypothetical protein